jgi:hypothetical protein
MRVHTVRVTDDDADDAAVGALHAWQCQVCTTPPLSEGSTALHQHPVATACPRVAPAACLGVCVVAICHARWASPLAAPSVDACHTTNCAPANVRTSTCQPQALAPLIAHASPLLTYCVWGLSCPVSRRTIRTPASAVTTTRLMMQARAAQPVTVTPVPAGTTMDS